MKISKKIILVLFLFCVFANSNAYAVIKLDFFEPVADFAQKVQKVKNKIEEKYTAQLQKLNEKVRKAIGAEGAALFQMVVKQGKYIIKQAVTGQLSMDDLSLKHMLDAVKSQLGDFKLDLATLLRLREDYLEAVKSERRSKEKDMQKELARLLAEREGLMKTVAQSTGGDQMQKLKQLQEDAEKLQVSIAEGQTTMKTYMQQLQKAQKENEKMQGYINTIREALGEKASESDQSDIQKYEQAIEMNNQTMEKIKAAIDKYNDMVDNLQEIQEARQSLNETIKTAITGEALEKLNQIDKDIASLQAQIVKNSAAMVQQDAYEERVNAVSEKINSIAAQISADALVDSLDSQVDAFFDKLGNMESNNDEYYGEGIQLFFLKEREVESPTSIARVAKERKKEFYDAYKNMTAAIIESYKATAQAEEQSEGCLDASMQQADGVFGAMSMRVCNDIQSAKAAIQYTSMLLAQLRLNAASDLQGWSDRYKMSNYGHDITILDLDAYVMGNKTMSNLLNIAKGEALDLGQRAKDMVTDEAASKLNDWATR